MDRCMHCGGYDLVGLDDQSGADCLECGKFTPEEVLVRQSEEDENE